MIYAKFQDHRTISSVGRFLPLYMGMAAILVMFLVWLDALRPGKQFFSHVGTEPPLHGYYQYFCG